MVSIAAIPSELEFILAEVRHAFRGPSPKWRVIQRKDGAAPVAALACLKRELVLPLREGKNLVGRSEHSDHGSLDAAPHFFETMQWRIHCDGGLIYVADAWTTNLSEVVPRDVPMQEDDRLALFDGGAISPQRVRVPHANMNAPMVQVHHGDVLCGAYASFVVVTLPSIIE